MKLENRITSSKLETVYCRIWTALAVLALVINNIGGIRVYEGTNFPGPSPKLQKYLGLSKKSLYISKRSWNPGDDSLKPPAKTSGVLDGKWKELNKRTTADVTPSLYKIKFNDKNRMQYLKYIKEIPRLEEYTFCLWYKATNLTHDQTLFLYSLNKNEVLLRLWINSIDSTLRMAIRENVVYKVPANIRQHKWHHICQSWNGISGELQMFLDGKRIGAGVLPHYKGTYIPEGGEVTLGHDVRSSGKRSDDALDGEMFGFNLVEESVPHDQGNFINSQYKPTVQASVPPFKKLPPIKKSYQEIKAYISALPPSDPSEARKKNEAFPGEETSIVKKPKDTYSISPKRNRGNHRIRYPPLRKVVVYNREDRQLPLNEALVELNKTTPVLPERKKVAEKPGNQTIDQPFDENYSIHSYRFGKQEKKTANYEIYESLEDDVVRPPTEEKQSNEELFKRKARQNFNLFTAREANKVYTLSSSVKNLKKPKFHFETTIEEKNKPEETNQKNSNVEESKATEVKKPEEKPVDRKVSDSIPVYEIEIAEERRKRSTDGERESKQFEPDDPLVDSNGFRRLPQIPEGFINLFSQNASKSEIEEKLDEFFPKSEPKEEANTVTEITETPKVYPVVTEAILIVPEATPNQQTGREISKEGKTPNWVTEDPRSILVPAFSPIPNLGKTSSIKKANYTIFLGDSTPVNFPLTQEPFQEFNPRRPFEGLSSSKLSEIKGQTADRRKFDVSLGTDLVMRSYGECTTDRGSPVREKQGLVISWADTPVRIFGGAEVLGARNECGNF